MLKRLARPTRTPALVAATVLCLSLSACSGSDEAADPTAEATTSESTDAPAAAAQCDYPADGQPAAKEVDPPPAEAPGDDATVTLSTSAGDIAVSLDGATAPCTVNSFLSLAEQGYFDDTTCHRLTTDGIFVLQCGDPTGTGAGGPGYSFDDELSGDETYGPGTLAMANAGPNTNGSQFFLVYDESPLPPNYTVFGEIDAESLTAIQEIGAKGTVDGGPDGAPKEAVDIETVTIS